MYSQSHSVRAVEIDARTEHNHAVPVSPSNPVPVFDCADDAPGQDALPDPIALIEILSPGNTQDTWDNVWAYTTIPSVREIALVHSTRVLAVLLRRGVDGHWPAVPVEIGNGDTLRLESIGFACPLRDAHAQTHLRERARSFGPSIRL